MKITELTVEQVNAVIAALEKQIDELRKRNNELEERVQTLQP